MTAVEEFITNQLPQWLKPSEPMPRGWESTEQEWRQLQTQAAKFERVRIAHQLAELIAVKGWTLHEALSGSLDRGREIGLLNGAVVDRRPPDPADARTRARAERVLDELSRTSGHGLSPIILADIESVAYGHAPSRGFERKLEEAESAISQARAASRDASRAALANTVEIECVRAASIGGRRLPQGRSRISRDALAELEQVVERFEEQAARITGGASRDPNAAGTWHAPWPPFVPVRETEGAPA